MTMMTNDVSGECNDYDYDKDDNVVRRSNPASARASPASASYPFSSDDQSCHPPPPPPCRRRRAHPRCSHRTCTDSSIADDTGTPRAPSSYPSWTKTTMRTTNVGPKYAPCPSIGRAYSSPRATIVDAGACTTSMTSGPRTSGEGMGSPGWNRLGCLGG